MNKQLITVLLLLFSISLLGQLNEIEIDEKSGRLILIGNCDKEGLSNTELGDWYLEEYEAYVPDKKTIRKIERKISEEINITIVLAIWCSDSRREVPRFLKILDLIDYNDNKISMYCTDREKEAPGVDIASLDIELVPTFIIYSGNIEIGRIIETPNLSLEEDFLSILKK